MLQEEGMSIEEKARGSRGPSLGPKASTNKSISVFFVISKVTSRRIVQIKGVMVVRPFKLQRHQMKMVMRVRVH